MHEHRLDRSGPTLKVAARVRIPLGVLVERAMTRGVYPVVALSARGPPGPCGPGRTRWRRLSGHQSGSSTRFHRAGIGRLDAASTGRNVSGSVRRHATPDDNPHVTVGFRMPAPAPAGGTAAIQLRCPECGRPLEESRTSVTSCDGCGARYPARPGHGPDLRPRRGSRRSARLTVQPADAEEGRLDCVVSEMRPGRGPSLHELQGSDHRYGNRLTDALASRLELRQPAIGCWSSAAETRTRCCPLPPGASASTTSASTTRGASGLPRRRSLPAVRR